MPHTVKLAAVRGGRILLVYKPDTKQWSLPGGKLKFRPKQRRMEKPLKGLRRELKEELPRLVCGKLKLWRRFRFVLGLSGVRESFQMSVFKGKTKGQLICDNEIAAAAWIKLDMLGEMPLSSNTRRIVSELIHEKNGYRKR